MFRSVPIAHEVLPAGSGAVRPGQHDTVTLGWEERLKSRARRRSDSGFEFATALARGTVLRAGDCFVFDQPVKVVEVVEQEEPVFVVRPGSPQEWALFSYHIGNSHQPLMLGESEIICPDISGMEQVLMYHSIPYTRAVRPFTPVGQLSAHQHRPA